MKPRQVTGTADRILGSIEIAPFSINNFGNRQPINPDQSGSDPLSCLFQLTCDQTVAASPSITLLVSNHSRRLIRTDQITSDQLVPS